MRSIGILAILALLGGPAAARAGEADVVGVTARCNEKRVCNFSVTVRHEDAGWKHYANRWEVLDPDGGVIATRVLRHPHVKEQPFTRGLPNVQIPEGVTRVRVRAHDLEHEFGGAELEVDIPPGAGEARAPADG